MKAFYSEIENHQFGPGATAPLVCSRARVAVYEAPGAAPRVLNIDPAPVGEYIEALASSTYDLARSQGGAIPYTVIREVSENFIHAGFAEPVVSILDGGHTIRFADQGPGIADKNGAVRPGFTTATSEMKDHIRGVGSGLPIVNDFMSVSGGRLTIEDNLGTGAVVTITAARQPVLRHQAQELPSLPLDLAPPTPGPEAPPLQPVSVGSRLSTRQMQVLALVMESGAAGPSLVSRELGVGVSTAYRDLAALEDQGLIVADGGKRTLTPEGMSYLDDLIGGS
jgi:anti-sigma regulatory factor (Ser/Thr protein kinase)